MLNNLDSNIIPIDPQKTKLGASASTNLSNYIYFLNSIPAIELLQLILNFGEEGFFTRRQKIVPLRSGLQERAQLMNLKPKVCIDSFKIFPNYVKFFDVANCLLNPKGISGISEICKSRPEPRYYTVVAGYVSEDDQKLIERLIRNNQDDIFKQTKVRVGFKTFNEIVADRMLQLGNDFLQAVDKQYRASKEHHDDIPKIFNPDPEVRLAELRNQTDLW